MFKKNILKLSITFFFVFSFCAYSHAEENFFSGLSGIKSTIPLTIDSENGVEWNRDEKYFVAKQSVIVKRGDVTLFSDQVKALYVDDENGNTIPTVFIATGNVRLSSKSSELICDKLIYHLNDKHIIATGKKLFLKHEDSKLQASKKIEFWMDKKLATITGNVKLEQKSQILKSDNAKVYFAKNNKKMTLKKIIVEGHVILISDGNIIQSEKGIYDAVSQKAELEGNVKISQGSSLLTAQKAEYNFKTKVSTLVGKSSIAYGGSNQPKVQGILIPSQLNNNPLSDIKQK